MTDDPKKKINKAVHDIDIGLNGLFGALGDALGEMVSKLEDGNSGAVTRDHVFETDKGPVRAQAGVRLQMGGLGARAQQTATPQPINPNRTKPQAAPQEKALEYDLFEEDDAWIFAADMPGVAQEELMLDQTGTHLHLHTIGKRRFRAEVDLGKAFDLAGVETALRNGVLTLTIPKGDA